MEEIFITTEYIKLDSFLKFTGETGTGGEAKLLVLDGKVKVNGEVCFSRGKKLCHDDVVSFGGKTYTIKGAEK